MISSPPGLLLLALLLLDLVLVFLPALLGYLLEGAAAGRPYGLPDLVVVVEVPGARVCDEEGYVRAVYVSGLYTFVIW